MGPIADAWREFQFDKCRLAARHTFDLNCNWKIAMEANTEVYHVKTIHPSTVAPILDDRRNVNTFYPNGHGRMVAPRPGDTKGMMKQRHPDIPEIETVGEIGEPVRSVIKRREFITGTSLLIKSFGLRIYPLIYMYARSSVQSGFTPMTPSLA
jgi:phenylpropionate dioxygenase-like ring-hydroxylating dioxygenase large terminal subunit